MADLSIGYLGMKLKSPVIIGSSGLTGTVSEVKKAAASGAGALVLKSIFEEQILNEIDLFIQDTGTADDDPFHVGYQSMLKEREHEYEEAYLYLKDHAKEQTLAKYLSFIEESKKSVDIPVIASINCISAYNWHYFARKIQEAGADALELNVYVLPSNTLKSSAENENVYFDIVEAVRKQVSIPVTLKIGNYFSALANTVTELSQTGIDGLVLFNRPFHPDIDINTLMVNAKYLLSDPSEYSNILRWIALLSGRSGCPLVASTGIHDAGSAIKLILAGATAVQVVSALYDNGLETIASINEGIGSWMGQKGYKTIDEFRGLMSQQNSSNPAEFERVQFMKRYSGIV
ncbi:MAG: dihydroorotate dehydrogenase-like protein [Bacteroidales bacterium]|nr:dihydroorotate dehydrogenase-like protein [Bacteroidales bacterium]